MNYESDPMYMAAARQAVLKKVSDEKCEIISTWFEPLKEVESELEGAFVARVVHKGGVRKIGAGWKQNKPINAHAGVAA